MPKSIIDGFCTVITIGLIPTLFIIFYKVGNTLKGRRTKSTSFGGGGIIAIILALLFAFKDSNGND
jgi:hypothetical protein